MNQEATTYLQQQHQNPQSFYMIDTTMESFVSSSSTATSGHLSHSQNLVYNFSMLKEKIQLLQPLVSLAISQGPLGDLSNVGTLIQEIMVTASSMMYNFQQLSLGPTLTPANTLDDEISGQATSEVIINYNHDTNFKIEKTGSGSPPSDASGACDIIELHASELLAKYTHYCQVCGKGFKRDANLRMHMRAHGDEYKTNAALTNPIQKPESGNSGSGSGKRKYSCPHEGCRWNRKHAKFQPLKSIICVKNHYKRSHCPKMYICNRCNRKQFSVLSDLRTHEKHCGDLRWMCSCGTTFSRKDKLMGHVSLFEGHVPVERQNTS